MHPHPGESSPRSCSPRSAREGRLCLNEGRLPVPDGPDDLSGQASFRDQLLKIEPCRHPGISHHARIAELKQLEHDLSQLGTLGKDLDPAECDPSGICGVISLEGEQIANREGP